MHLINQTRYKIVITDDPDYTDDGDGLLDPEPMYSSGCYTRQEIAAATRYLKNYYDRQMDALQGLDLVTVEDEEEDWDSQLLFEINHDFDNDPIDDEDYKDLMSVLNDIVRCNAVYLNKPRPVIEVDIYKYATFAAGTDNLIYELEYMVHECVDDWDAAE